VLLSFSHYDEIATMQYMTFFSLLAPQWDGDVKEILAEVKTRIDAHVRTPGFRV